MGQFDAVDRLLRQAKQLYQSAHDTRADVDALTEGAIVLQKRGGYPAAKAGQEEA
jgi:hypothetical protein